MPKVADTRPRFLPCAFTRGVEYTVSTHLVIVGYFPTFQAQHTVKKNNLFVPWCKSLVCRYPQMLLRLLKAAAVGSQKLPGPVIRERVNRRQDWIRFQSLV